MAHKFADAEIRILPKLVLLAIRNNAYLVQDGIEIEDIRALSRVVSRAAAAGHDIMPVMVDYAAAVDDAMPRLVDWSAEMHMIHELVWPFNASSYALQSTFWADAGKPKGPVELRKAIEAWRDAQEAEQAVPLADADRDIRAEMDRVNLLFPRLGLSYGYIGNIWSAPYSDDRSFYIFTQVQHLDSRHGGSVKLGGNSYEELSKMRTLVLAKLEDWARDLDQRLIDNQVRLRSTSHLSQPPARIAA